MDQKGFSLLELIVVIAIMAILIVVVTPQYLKYVERSRNTTDVRNAKEIVQALQIYALDPDIDDPVPTQGTIGDPDGWETITIFNKKTQAWYPDGEHARVDQWAKRALVHAGLLENESSLLYTTCQSRNSWESYSIHYRSDG